MIHQKVAHYRITAKLGQGGMGEVYRATDTKLGREVAIKVLPESFAQDKERLARFEREAKALAALNHPNIAGIYGLEQTGKSQALVLEMVEGEDLSDRLKRGALPVEEALDVCEQIAEALEAAHEKGIIHRDLKPGNVKLTADGKVKVLDFGLAKTATADTSSIDPDSPTLTADYTMPGTLLGTAGYMSPEQARGKPVDKRSDIWSFGVVLFECLTGQRLFSGETVTDSIGALLHKEIDWSQLPPDTPPTIHLLLRKCLIRDRKRRLQDIGDARVDLEQAVADPTSSFIRLSEGALKETKAGRGISRSLVAGLVLSVAVIAVALTWFLKPAPVPAPPLAPPARHAELVLPGPYRFTAESGNDSFALSPDGRHLIYSLADQGPGLRLLDLASGEDKPIPGTKAVQEGHPFFSPDGSRFGCLLGYDLMTMPIRGGTPVPLRIGKFLNLSFLGFLGADWSKQGIVFASPFASLRMVSTDGGNPTELTELKKGEVTDAFPQFLPGGKQILFVVVTGSTESRVGHLEVVNIATRQLTKLNIKGFEGCNYARYSPSGHLLYELGGDVFAVAFNPQRLETIGTPKLVLKGVAVDPGGRAQFDVASDGTLIYLPGEDLASRQMTKTLAWIDPNGQARPFTQKRRPWYGFNLSPDEKRVALTMNWNIWILDKTQEGNEKLRVLINDPFPEWSPHWSKDGVWIYFTSVRQGKFSIWKKKAEYSEAPAQLVWEAPFAPIGVQSVSGSDLIFDHPDRIATGGLGNGDNVSFELWRLPLNQENATPEPILKKPGVVYFNPALSPDGKWLAYASTEEGGAPRVYVRAMHGSTESEKVDEKVSDGPGQHPCWSKDGHQIFYQSGPDFYSATVTAQDGRLVANKAVKVLSFNGTIFTSLWNSWTVAGENNRILALVNADDVGLENKVDVKPASSTGPTHLEIVANWFTELNKEAPPAGAN